LQLFEMKDLLEHAAYLQPEKRETMKRPELFLLL